MNNKTQKARMTALQSILKMVEETEVEKFKSRKAKKAVPVPAKESEAVKE
jgi:hypothetical protein